MVGCNWFVDANEDLCPWFGYVLQVVRSLACYFFKGASSKIEDDNTLTFPYHYLYASIKRSVEIGDTHGVDVPFFRFDGFVDHISVLLLVVGFQLFPFIISNIVCWRCMLKGRI